MTCAAATGTCAADAALPTGVALKTGQTQVSYANAAVSATTKFECGPGYTVTTAGTALTLTCTSGALGYTTASSMTCIAVTCAVNQYVSAHVCTACATGYTNVVGDDASGADTTCDLVTGACTATAALPTGVALKTGQTQTSYLNAGVSATTAFECGPGYTVTTAGTALTLTCTSGALGYTTASSMTCISITCAVNQYVSNHVCTASGTGYTNVAGDAASGADTTCDLVT